MGERRQQQPHLIAQPRHGVEHAAGEHERKGLVGQLEPRHHGRRRRHELVGRAIENAGGHHVAVIARMLHVLRQRGDRARAQLFVVHLVNQLRCLLHAEVAQQPRRQAGDAPAAICVSHDRAQCEPADPVAAAFVAEHVAPAACARRLSFGIAAVRNRSGAGDDDDAWRIADAGLQARSAHH